MIDDLVEDAQLRMEKSVANLQKELSKLRTGRASTALLDHIQVDYYGTLTPLNQVATLNVNDARTISISPWVKAMTPVIEKAIIESDLGLNPASAGESIKVPIPPLTEERRREITRLVRSEGESCKIAIRNIRRACNTDLKEWLKEKEITEDDERQGVDRIQKVTDEFTVKIDEVVKLKETEVMTV